MAQAKLREVVAVEAEHVEDMVVVSLGKKNFGIDYTEYLRFLKIIILYLLYFFVIISLIY